MIKREKRKYVVLVMMSCFMIFTLTFAFIGFEQALSYGETSGVIKSVNVREVEIGSYDDRSYRTESTVCYNYTANGKTYTQTKTLRADYTGREGETIPVVYKKSDPHQSSISSHGQSMFSGIAFLISSFVLLCYIIYDIIVWIRKRKAENAQIAWQDFTSDELLALSIEKKKRTKNNVLLLILSILCTFLFLFFAIPLWAFTIAKIMDVKLCYPLPGDYR